MAEKRRYLAYMVRLWAVHHNGELIWRASVGNAHKGEHCPFTDLAVLFGFLQAATEQELAACGQLEAGRTAKSAAGSRRF